MNKFVLVLLASFFCISPAIAELNVTSPSEACGLLKKLDLTTRGWKNYNGQEFGCSSAYKELGAGFPLANNLAYYVTGSRDTVSEVKLVLNVNNRSMAKDAHQELLKAAKILCQKVSGEQLPKPVESAIKNGQANSGKVGNTIFEVIRKDWPTGKGYEVKVVFK